MRGSCAIAWLALAGCRSDPRDPELAWSRVVAVLPSIPVLASRCAVRAEQLPEGVTGVWLLYDEHCALASVVISPVDDYVGPWLGGDRVSYRRAYRGELRGSVTARLPDGWAIVLVDDD